MLSCDLAPAAKIYEILYYAAAPIKLYIMTDSF